jgi:hypothetical protein
MKNFLLLAGAAAALSLGFPAHAEAPDKVERLHDFGRCVVKSDREAAADLLQAIPIAPADVEIAALQLGDARDCLKEGRLSARSTLIRGALAQGLLLKDFPRFGVEPNIPEHRFVKLDLPLDGAAPGVDQRTATLYKVADCVVRNQALKTETLFRSAPASGPESRLFDAIAPYIEACAGNADLRVSRPEFRGMLAQAAYSVSIRYWTGELWSAK